MLPQDFVDFANRSLLSEAAIRRSLASINFDREKVSKALVNGIRVDLSCELIANQETKSKIVLSYLGKSKFGPKLVEELAKGFVNLEIPRYSYSLNKQAVAVHDRIDLLRARQPELAAVGSTGFH